MDLYLGNGTELEMTPEQRRTMEISYTITCSLSIISTLFIIMTFLVFEEKRKTTTSVYILFQTVAALGISIVFLLYVFYLDEVMEEEYMCKFQFYGIMFFSNCLVYSYLCISFNMYFLIAGPKRKRELKPEVFLPLILIVSFICGMIPFFFDNAIAFDGFWCYIADNNILAGALALHAGLVVTTILGSVLWVINLFKTKKIFESQKRLSWRTSSYDYSAIQNDDDQMSLSNSEQKNLFIRQIIYLIGFLIMFIIISIEICLTKMKMLTFGAWYVQGGAISLIGVYIFLVFGATKKNFELWKSVCCSRHDYDHF